MTLLPMSGLLGTGYGLLVSGRACAISNPTSLPLWSVAAALATVGMKSPGSNSDIWDVPGVGMSEELSLRITSLGKGIMTCYQRRSRYLEILKSGAYLKTGGIRGRGRNVLCTECERRLQFS